MTDRPILFSAPMIRALLEEKTQDRRLAWRECPGCFGDGMGWAGECGLCNGTGQRPTIWQKVKPGDRLWVRETWSDYWSPLHGLSTCEYKATASDLRRKAKVWRPSTNLPRWASRLTLCVTDVRRERLRDISEGDAVSEGSLCLPLTSLAAGARGAFAEIWSTIHGPDAWEANPEVVALTFTVHKANIDQLGERAA